MKKTLLLFTTATVVVLASRIVSAEPPAMSEGSQKPCVACQAKTPAMFEERQKLLDAFNKAGWVVTDEMIDTEIARIIHEQYKDDRPAFERDIQAQGHTTASFRAAQRDNVAVQCMRYQLQKEAREIAAHTGTSPK